MTLSASVAQSVERTALNRTVAGSSPAGGCCFWYQHVIYAGISICMSIAYVIC